MDFQPEDKETLRALLPRLNWVVQGLPFILVQVGSISPPINSLISANPRRLPSKKSVAKQDLQFDRAYAERYGNYTIAVPKGRRGTSSHGLPISSIS